MSFYNFSVSPRHAYHVNFFQDFPSSYDSEEEVAERTERTEQLEIEEVRRFAKITPEVLECGSHKEPHCNMLLQIVVGKKAQKLHWQIDMPSVIDGFEFGNRSIAEKEFVVWEERFRQEWLGEKLGWETFLLYKGVCLEEIHGESIAHILHKVVLEIMPDEVKQKWFPKTHEEKVKWAIVDTMRKGGVYKSKEKGFFLLTEDHCSPLSALDEEGQYTSIYLYDVEVDAEGVAVEYDYAVMQSTIQTMLTSNELNNRNQAKHIRRLHEEMLEQKAKEREALEAQLAALNKAPKEA